MGGKHQTRRRFGLVEVKNTPTFVQFQVLTNSKLLSKVQKPDVSLVTCSQNLLKIAKKLQLQTVFVIGVVRDIHLAPTHVDASTELLTMTFTSTPTKQAQRTGTTGELSAYKPQTAEECKALAEASNIRYWGGAGHSSGADPRGCIYRTPDKDIYFNTHKTGSTNRGDRRTVCVPRN